MQKSRYIYNCFAEKLYVSIEIAYKQMYWAFVRTLGLLMVLLPLCVVGQELIPNGSFEKYRTCPWQDNLLDEATPWYNPNKATPDFYHNCFQTGQMEVPPHSGQGLARLFMDQGWAEYLATPLKKPLDADEAYFFEMYISSGTPSRYPAESFGAYFSNQPLTSTEKALLTTTGKVQVLDNQVRALTQVYKWERITGCFIAKGGENYMTIGNFTKLPPLLGYYYLFVDDISLLHIKLNLGNDTTLCGRKSTHLLNAKTPGATEYKWSDGSTSPTFLVKRPGTYSVTVITPCKVLRDTITIKYTLDFDLGPDTTLCDGQKFMLTVPIAASTYRWQDGTQQNRLQISRAGTYSVRVGDPGCIVNDTIQVKYILPPQLDLGLNKELCGAEVYTIKPVFSEGKFRWQDQFADIERPVNSSGVYYALVTNDCATIRDSIVVDYGECGCIVYAPEAFSPNADGVNDLFQPFACGDITITSLSIFDRWGEIVFHTNAPPFQWDGLYKGELSPHNVYAWRIHYLLKQRGKETPKQKQGMLTLVR